MSDYGIKVSKPGYDVKTAAANNLVFSSEYSTLRVKQQGSGTVKHSTGRTVTIAHNLGYVPMFLVHSTPAELWSYGGGFYQSGDYFINPVVPVVTGACHLGRGVTAYADDTNLYIEVEDDVGWDYFHPSTSVSEDYAYEYNSGGYWTDYTIVGYSSSSSSAMKGAMRFNNVDISQGTSLVRAEWGFYITDRDGSSNVKTTIYGIDEDNTGAFNSGTAATARTKTSASSSPICDSGLGSGSLWRVGVKNQVQEIINRGGWSSGNSLGLIIEDNGTNTSEGNLIKDYGSGGFYCQYSSLRTMTNDDLIDYKYTIFYNKIE